MAWISMVPLEEAKGLLKCIYENALERSGRIWNIVRITSLRPVATDLSMKLYGSIMFGPSELSRAEREMVAVVVSRTNHCHY